MTMRAGRSLASPRTGPARDTHTRARSGRRTKAAAGRNASGAPPRARNPASTGDVDAGSPCLTSPMSAASTPTFSSRALSLSAPRAGTLASRPAGPRVREHPLNRSQLPSGSGPSSSRAPGSTVPWHHARLGCQPCTSAMSGCAPGPPRPASSRRSSSPAGGPTGCSAPSRPSASGLNSSTREDSPEARLSVLSAR